MREIGIPKYLKEDRFSAMENWNTWAISLKVLGEEFHSKIWHFLLLTSPPEASRKESKIPLNREAMVVEAPPKIRVSFANCEWFMFFTLLAI